MEKATGRPQSWWDLGIESNFGTQGGTGRDPVDRDACLRGAAGYFATSSSHAGILNRGDISPDRLKGSCRRVRPTHSCRLRSSASRWISTVTAAATCRFAGDLIG